MDTTHRRNSFIHLVQQEISLVQQFITALEKEFAATTNRDIDTLEQVTEEKRVLVAELSALEQKRNRLLEDSGFAAGVAGIEPFLDWCDSQQQAGMPWNKLLELASICRAQNRKNRQLIELCSQHASEALRVLRGEEPGAETYCADGDRNQRPGGRSLARA